MTKPREPVIGNCPECDAPIGDGVPGCVHWPSVKNDPIPEPVRKEPLPGEPPEPEPHSDPKPDPPSAADDPSPGYIFTGPTEGGVGSE